MHPLVDRAHPLDGRAARRQRLEEGGGERPARERGIVELEARPQLARQRAIAEGDVVGGAVEGEVEGVERPDVRGQLHQHLQLAQPILGTQERKGRPGDEVARRILLPAQLAGRRDAQAVALDAGAGVGGGAQPDEVGPERGGRRIAVARQVLQEDSHRSSLADVDTPDEAAGFRGQRPVRK